MRIRNWEKYQHYKHRNPPWIKLYKKLLDDPEWFALGDAASRMLANCLLLASEADGELPEVDTIAFRLRMPVKKVTELIPQLNHWVEHDASNMLARCKHVAHKVSTETETETETETDSCAIDFEKFWTAYPRRDGANPKAPAQAKFQRAVRDGARPEAIIEGAKAYASNGATKVGTEFVATAVVWLNQRRWEDYAPDPNAKPKFTAEEIERGRDWYRRKQEAS